MNKTIYPLILAALTAALLPAPSLAQATSASGTALPSFIPAATTTALPSFLAGTSNAIANTAAGAASGAALSGGTTGVFGNTSALTGAGPMGMGGLTTALTSTQNLGLPQAGQGLLAPGSVNQSAFPSQQWSYGFPNEGTGLYRGVTGGSIGGFLPATSTSSVNLNTVDCPFIRMPTEGDGVGGGPGTGGGNINFGINLPGGVNINGNLNTQQAINSLQNFFGSGN
jgi:hypothetical protein